MNAKDWVGVAIMLLTGAATILGTLRVSARRDGATEQKVKDHGYRIVHLEEDVKDHGERLSNVEGRMAQQRERG